MGAVADDVWQDIPLELDPRVRDLLGDSVALNTTASVKQDEESSKWCTMPAFVSPAEACQMRLCSVPLPSPAVHLLLSIMRRRKVVLAMGVQVLCGHADEFVRVGNRTECALLELCSKLGVEVGPLQEGHQIVQVYPFSSDRKRMTSITYQTGAS